MSLESLLDQSRRMAAWNPPEAFVALADRLARQNAGAALARAAAAVAGQKIGAELILGSPQVEPKTGD